MIKFRTVFLHLIYDFSYFFTIGNFSYTIIIPFNNKLIVLINIKIDLLRKIPDNLIFGIFFYPNL